MDIAHYKSLCKGFTLSCIALFVPFLMAQSRLNKNLKTKQASWQQRVDHKMSATLFPDKHELQAEETVVYTNNSPDELKEIWFHVWPNAFKNNHTGYGKEAMVLGNKKFFDATNDQRGWVDGLSFTVDGQNAHWEYHPEHIDIVRVDLPQPLRSGATITIQIPFHVKIPWLFSRMGVNENIFALTQWYPKPAVYDANGWNTFPYLEQGEYYSEYGTYNVAITVPSNFVVGATGKLLDSTEQEWMEEVSEGNRKAPKDATKTLHYLQENVLDFAWFASPDFEITMGVVVLPDSHRVKTRAFYKKEYESKSIHAPNGSDIVASIEKAIKYYSKRVGYYPFDYCSVVIGPLQGAGGMEYPMITICGDAGEGTIVHEVGHNWFQGMLGSQERDHPWMDESINTFYHMQAADGGFKELSPGDKIDPSSTYMQFRFTHDIGVFQEGNLHSSEYQAFNYGTIVYGANPQRFMYLQEYFGRKLFDSCMKTYFKKWQYKHPLPQDMQDVFEQVSHQDLKWFFQGLLGGSAPDFAISSVHKKKDGFKVKINNKGAYNLPITVGVRRSTLKDHFWISGKDTTIVIPGRQNEISLNSSGYLPESNLSNNDAKTKGIFKTWGKTKLGFPNLWTRGTNRIWILPNVFTVNSYDGYMPGLVISNFSLPRRNWEWWALPMYGTKSGNFTGLATLQRNIYHKKGCLNLTEISANFSTFSFTPGSTGQLNSYYHFAPKIITYLKRNKPWVQNSLELEYDKNRLKSNRDTLVKDKYSPLSPDLQNDIFRFAFVKEVYKKLSPEKYLVQLEAGKNMRGRYSTDSAFKFLKLTMTAEKFIPYRNKKKKSFGLKVKGFAQGLLWQMFKENSNGVYNPVISGANGANDYGMRTLMLGRSENFRSSSFWSNQLLPGGLGMRMVPNVTAKSWMAGLNAQTHIIPGIGLQAYADAVVANTAKKNMDLFYTAGLSYSENIGLNTIWEVNLPLVYSTNAQAGTTVKHFYNYVNFRLNFGLYGPVRVMRQVYQ